MKAKATPPMAVPGKDLNSSRLSMFVSPDVKSATEIYTKRFKNGQISFDWQLIYLLL